MTFQWFLVEGLNPEPWTASQASVGKRGGKNYVQFYKPEQLRLYQESFAVMFRDQNPQAVQIDGDIQLWLYFWRQLTLNQMYEGKNRRTHVADATNLQKATEDALQGILFQNDRSIRHVRSTIIEQDRDTEPRILVGVGIYGEEEEQEVKDVEVIAASLSRGFGSIEDFAEPDIDFDAKDFF